MRLLFLIIIALSAIAGYAQENLLKFFEDGKYWVCKGYNRETNDYYQFRVSVVGDTVVGGVTARKLQSEMVETGEKSANYQIGYEADGKVYIWLNDDFRVFFDFVNIGYENPHNKYDYFGQIITDEIGLMVESPSTKVIEGINRKVYRVNCYDATEDISCLGIHYWIEGIGEWQASFLTVGSTSDPFWDYLCIEECYLNDTCIYINDEFFEYPTAKPSTDPDLSSISEIERDKVNEPVYDLMGRKVINPQPGHIYVTPSGKRLF